MKCPVSSSSVPLSSAGGDEDDEEWTDFGGSCSCECHTPPGATGNASLTTQQQWTGQKKESPFQHCFPALRLTSPALTKERRLLADNDNRLQFWEDLCDHSVSPNSVGQNEAILLQLRASVIPPPSPEHSLPPALDLPTDSEPFDWQQKEREVTPVPTFVRPGKPESPVDINFDHSQAAFGLSQLGEDDLRQMKAEMSEKFQHLSEVLVRELQERDQLIHSLNVKNNFVSALLKVQSKRYHPTDEKLSTAKYLRSVIPFHPPTSGNWSTTMLQQLTKILDAIAGNSDTVPDLVSSYIQSEVLKE